MDVRAGSATCRSFVTTSAEDAELLGLVSSPPCHPKKRFNSRGSQRTYGSDHPKTRSAQNGRNSHLPLSPFFAVIRGTGCLSHSLCQLHALLMRIGRHPQRQNFRLLPDHSGSMGMDSGTYSPRRGINSEAADQQAYAHFARLVC